MRAREKRLQLGDLERDSRTRFPPSAWVALYWLNQQGVSAADLAKANGISRATCWRYIARGRDLFAHWHAPQLEVLIGDYNGLVPRCEHGAPIQVGDKVVCCVCFVSGYDETAEMQVTPKELEIIAREGAPEPTPDTRTYAEKKFGGRKRARK